MSKGRGSHVGKAFCAIAVWLVASQLGCSPKETDEADTHRTREEAVSSIDCSGPSADGTCQRGSALFGMVLPLGRSRDQIAVWALRDLRIDDRVQVLDVGNQPAEIANQAPEGVTDVGVEAVVGNLASASPVILRDRSRVAGNVVAADSLTQGNILHRKLDSRA
jgi:hypothetical protein